MGYYVMNVFILFMLFDLDAEPNKLVYVVIKMSIFKIYGSRYSINLLI